MNLIHYAIATLFAAVACLASPAGAVAGDQRYSTLAEAVEAQALDPQVLGDLREDGDADGFLILDDEWRLAQADGGTMSEEAFEQTLPLLAERKAAILAPFGQSVELLREYEALPLSLVRFYSERALLGLLNDSRVVGVGANLENEAVLAESLPLIRQPQTAALGARGARRAVAIIDSGVDFTRAAFGSCTAVGTPAGCRVTVAQDFAPNDNVNDNALDNFHGTNVAGIALGVAPDASILSLDVFQANPNPTPGAPPSVALDADIFAAINWIVLNRWRQEISALNLSLGVTSTFFDTECSWNSIPFVPTFMLVRAVGVVPVVAAGNTAFQNGRFISGVARPACAPEALRVGAVYDSNAGNNVFYDVNGDGVPNGTDCLDPTTAADQVVCFSQSGPLLSLLAPGAGVTAAGVQMWGTSQAAPHVAGAVAVLASASPQATVDEILAALSSGPQVTDARNNLARPRLDLRAALAYLGPCAGGRITIRGTVGNDVLIGTHGDDVIAGLAGNDTIVGLGGRDLICAGEGDDIVSGGPGGDDIVGEEGHDSLDGGDGRDWLLGLDGNDVLVDGPGGAGDYWDIVFGGGGIDTVDYSARASAVNVSLDDQPNDGAPGEIDSIGSDVENIVGGSGNDRLSGYWTANRIEGGPGDDTLIDGDGLCPSICAYPKPGDVLVGGGDTDTAYYAGRNGPQRLSLDGIANDGFTGERDNIQTDVENIVGGSGDDTLHGSANDNVLDGGSGADVFYGGAGGDEIRARDQTADRAECGTEPDSVVADFVDTIAADCEAVSRA